MCSKNKSTRRKPRASKSMRRDLLMETAHVNSESFQTGAYQLDKFGSSAGSHVSKKQQKQSRGSPKTKKQAYENEEDNPPRQRQLFSILDFKNKTQSHTNSIDLSSAIYKINLQKKSFNPLPNHIYKPKTFSLLKVCQKDYPNELIYNDVYTVSGEDNPLHGSFRSEMIYLFFDANAIASRCPLVYYCLISRAAYQVILESNKYSRLLERLRTSEYGLLLRSVKFTDNMEHYQNGTDRFYENPKQCPFFVQSHELKFSAHNMTIFQKTKLYSKLEGYRIAKTIIELLNNPQNLDNHSFANYVRDLFYYSIVNIGLTFFEDKDYHSIIAFVNGLVSTTLVSPIIEKFNSIMALPEFTSNPKVYNKFKFVHNIFKYLHSYYIRNINSIYIPNYGLGVLCEFKDEFVHFTTLLSQDSVLTSLTQSPSRKQNHYDSISAENNYNKLIFNLAHIEELKDFLINEILTPENILISQLRHQHNNACDFPFKKIFSFLQRYLIMCPSNSGFVQSNHKYMCLLEKLYLLYRMACSAILDNIFSESLYLFVMRFSGITLFAGFDMDFINSMYQDVDFLFDGHHLHHYFRTQIAYLTRIVSFFMYRYRIYLRNLVISKPYPNSSLFDIVRFESRRVPNFFISETHLSSFLHQSIKFENYPHNNPHFDINTYAKQIHNDNYQQARPNNPLYMSFNDTKFSENINKDFNYSQVQHYLQSTQFNLNNLPPHLLRFSKFGLLINIDFRPDLDTMSNDYLSLNNEYFSHNEATLKDYANDREILLDISFRDGSDSEASDSSEA